MSRIVDVEPLDCLAWKGDEHGTTFDDGVLWVLEKIGKLPTIERKTDEWCTDCQEYDSEKHCCPRFNRVIRQTLSEQPGMLRKDLRKLPSVQPEVILCKDCKHHHYESEDIPYCDRIDYGYGWKDYDFCSFAERKQDANND